jgi:hypothetical protein
MTLMERARRLDERAGLAARPGSGVRPRELLHELVRPPMLWWAIVSIALVGLAQVFMTSFGVVGIMVGYGSLALCAHRAANRVRERRDQAAGPPTWQLPPPA